MNNEEFFIKLEEQIQSGNPFVAYRNPGSKNELTKALLQDSAETYKTDDFTEKWICFCSL